MASTDGKIYPSVLPSPFIRLLSLDSGSDEPVRVTLHEVNLENAPAYDCLSYTWSDPLYHALSLEEEIHRSNDKREHSILCNGQNLLITESLLLALKEFSKDNNEDSSRSGKVGNFKRERFMWIDGICINQDSIEERNIQVGMMGEIYTKCSQVIIWLGVSDFHSPYAIEVINLLSKIPPENYIGLRINDLEDWDIYPKLGIEEVETWKWLEYAAFLQRTWFSRIWVVQEAFLPRSVVVVCGSDVIGWENITACAKVLRETGLGTLLMELLVETVDNIEGTVYVNNTLNNQSIFQSMRDMATLGSEEMGKVLNLEKLLYYSRFFDATNPKDKIYAIRGIWEKGGKTIPLDMTPDYQRDPTVASVYTRAALEVIFETKDLNILSLVEDYSLATQNPNSVRAVGNLPSWVPDFNSSSNPQPLAGNPRPQPGSERWNAARGIPFEVPILSPLESRHLLPITGYRIDIISESAANQAEIMGNNFGFDTVLELLANYPSQKYPHIDDDTETYFEGFWRTLIKDTFQKLPAKENARNAFRYFITVRVSELSIAYNYALSKQTPDLPKLQKAYEKNRQLINDLSKHRLNGSLIPTWEDLEELIEIAANEDLTDPEKAKLDKDYGDFYESFRIAYAGRRMFRTEKGYWGIAAQTLNIDNEDEIWVIAGSKVPMALRPVKGSNGENRELIGEAYVHGLMNGEALKFSGERLKSFFLE
ncbi:putative heterokaryon incompatibility protein [Botrytis fragariae]|uniref:Putative heterokaryon incompatibility protein n=1 Tax=Botrytis fragariae TaxID=1964551 RepID=A0A8H6AWI8_9HELO|nr:putative heterokaryon incompatibility protein [Botrytis fragariae]KAF5874775.1 putative heterokaryon incompatibility protein [Botrytis fragariae]